MNKVVLAMIALNPIADSAQGQEMNNVLIVWMPIS